MATMRYLVQAVDPSIAFYQGLGFVLIEQYGPAMAILRRDALTLWLAGPMASASRPLPDGRQPGPGGWNRVVIETADLEDLVARLRAGGAKFRNEILAGPGGRQILVEDPSGNVIELFETSRD